MSDSMLEALASLWCDDWTASRMVVDGAFETEQDAREWAGRMRQDCERADLFADLMGDDEKQHPEI